MLRDSLMLIVMGVAAGFPLSLLLGKALTTAFYGVKPHDTVSYAFAGRVLPAYRAAGVAPLTALWSD